MNGFSQGELDAYKYIIVPTSYSKYKSHVWKEDDKYKLNTLTAFLFKKKGFQTFMEGENFPEDLLQNPCLALTVQMVDNSNLFTPRLFWNLKTAEKSGLHLKDRHQQRKGLPEIIPGGTHGIHSPRLKQ